MKWKDSKTSDGDRKLFNARDEVEAPEILTKAEFRRAVKSFHPDKSDPFLREINTRKMQKLLGERNAKKDD